ncbi:hypothetical protein X975_22543, partial [Stegodyphus mimosarum]
MSIITGWVSKCTYFSSWTFVQFVPLMAFLLFLVKTAVCDQNCKNKFRSFRHSVIVVCEFSEYM